MADSNKLKMEIKIDNYELVKKLGRGAFGEVYMGIHESTRKEVAIKLETRETKFPQLFHEAKILKVSSSMNFCSTSQL
jgi:serine/threonine protein kinase